MTPNRFGCSNSFWLTSVFFHLEGALAGSRTSLQMDMFQVFTNFCLCAFHAHLIEFLCSNQTTLFKMHTIFWLASFTSFIQQIDYFRLWVHISKLVATSNNCQKI